MNDYTLQDDIEDMWGRYQADEISTETASEEDYAVLDSFLNGLEDGEVRAAEPYEDGWQTNEWVKHGILLNFGLRETTVQGEQGGTTFYDKFPLRDTEDLAERGTRVTPPASALRRGSYAGSDAIFMSPNYVNIGAYIGDETLIDSHATIGSCAQIGEDVKIGANTLIGGVLEPVENSPVIIEDGVNIGGGSAVTSGFKVGEDSVVAENTLLTPRVPVYDLVDHDPQSDEEPEPIYGEIPEQRRAFARFVPSETAAAYFEGGAYKPAVIATDLSQETLGQVEHEDALRE